MNNCLQKLRNMNHRSCIILPCWIVFSKCRLHRMTFWFMAAAKTSLSFYKRKTPTDIFIVQVENWHDHKFRPVGIYLQKSEWDQWDNYVCRRLLRDDEPSSLIHYKKMHSRLIGGNFINEGRLHPHALQLYAPHEMQWMFWSEKKDTAGLVIS